MHFIKKSFTVLILIFLLLPQLVASQRDHATVASFEKDFQEGLKGFEQDHVEYLAENIKSLHPQNESQNFRKKYLVALYQYKKGEFVEAIENLLEVVQYSKSNNDSLLLANSYHNLGNAYYRSNMRNLSKKYFREAVQMKKFLDVKDYARVYQALGSINLEEGIGKNDSLIYSSISSYEMVIKIYQKENMIADEALSTSLLAESYYQLNQHKKALTYINRAISLAQEVKDLKQINFAMIKKASFLSASNKKEEALKIIEKPVQYFKDNAERQTYLYALEEKYKILMSLNRFEEANKVGQEKSSVNVEIYNSKYTDKIAELEASYDKLDKEKKLAIQEKEITENKLAIRNRGFYSIIFASLFTIISIILFGYFRRSQFIKKQLQKEIVLKEELNTITTENKLQEQRLSISRDLHDNIGSQLTFIISSVDTLKHLADDKSEKLNSKISNISQFTKDTIYELRDTIWAMNKREISLEDLNARISNYVENANQNLENINFEFQNTESVHHISFDSKTGISIYRFIQEAVNNAIKHADSSKINICFREENNLLIIEIADNGKGFNPDLNSNGNGLKSMQKRAEEVGARFYVESTEKGTKVSMKMIG